MESLNKQRCQIILRYIQFMRKGHIATLGASFLIGFFYQPSWVYDNFWFKADFYDSIPFKVPYIVFQLVCAIVWTGVVELFIRFVKKYC